ncbi:MAG TPA: NAD-dependent dihydropyrimidine dehydrogenase subunit PreA [Ignavibacteriaceae bacterium]|nr:NAD-dependent dihydropyrimidine dehydrogenase subunit PreA [Ignavibacteriaceae bacterium]
MNGCLEVYSNGLRFENPFILASAPPTASAQLIKNAFKKGWAGAVTKTIRDEDVLNSNVSPRLSAIKDRRSVIGLENIEMISDKPIGYWLEAIADIKKEFPGKILIGSIMGAQGTESWKKIARRVMEAGADALELNFSCPNGVTAQGLGLAIGQNTKAIEVITKAVKEVCRIPVIVKLTPNVTSIAGAARGAVKGGADGICAINTISVLSGIDIETMTPLPDVDGYSTYGGLSGRCIKPIGLRCVAEIANETVVPIYGAGGISCWEDAVEYMAVGARIVQICTEVMLSGSLIIDGLKRGLAGYLERKGFASVGEICGVALNKLITHQALNRGYIVHPQIDYSKCGKCENCVEICSESGNGALYVGEEGVIADNKKCIGCSLCSFICPNGAISMIPTKLGITANMQANF